MASWQKGRLEKNHEFIRYILPKGRPFTMLTKAQVVTMMNHINNTITYKVVKDIRTRAFNHLEILPLSSIDSHLSWPLWCFQTLCCDGLVPLLSRMMKCS